MALLFQLGEGSVTEVREAMDDPPSYSAVRALLGLLLEKGHVRHKKDGRKYVYSPAVAPSKARKSAMHHLVRTFFGGSMERAVSYLLDSEAKKLSDEELDRLATRIAEARQDRQDPTGNR